MLGTWTGFYSYDNKQFQKVIGFDKTKFTIIIEKFDGKIFEGIINDDPKTGGMKEEGHIRGEIKNSKLTFIKHMPHERLIDLQSGERFESEKKHSPLFYEGEYRNENVVYGTWKFKKQIVFLYGFIPILFSPGTGHWEMTKEILDTEIV